VTLQRSMRDTASEIDRMLSYQGNDSVFSPFGRRMRVFDVRDAGCALLDQGRRSPWRRNESI